MTEETQASSAETQTEDPRFEVKWKKKETASAAPLPREGEDAPSSTPTADGVDLQRKLEEEQQRSKDLYDRWQRAAADLVNLRRRTESERSDVEKFASMVLVSELLPVLDNFDRALTTIPGNLAMLTWIHGVMLI